VQAFLDQRDGAVQGGDDGVGAAEELGGARGRLGDVDDRNVEQFLQSFPAVFAVPGLDDGVERLRVGADGLHHGDGGEVALVVALDGLRAEGRGQGNDLGPW
jgi:hypothetical protein